MTAVLVTRAEPGAGETAARMAERGWTPVVAPLLTIEAAPEAVYETDGAQALIFSSANGVRAFAGASAARDLPALCVGGATAEAARGAGFSDVRSAAGDADALIELADQTLQAGGGPALWPAGAHVSLDIAATLRAAGFDARRITAYRAVAAQRLPDAAAEALAGGALAGVLFHSARAAEIFAAVAPREPVRPLVAACMSARVAEAAKGLDWARLAVAASPEEIALFDAMEAVLAASGA